MSKARIPLLGGAVAVGGALVALSAAAQQPTPEQTKMIMSSMAEGARTWAAVCESCHGPPNPNTPPRTALLEMTADHIYASLTTGKMKFAGDTITESQRRAISMYLTGKPLSEAATVEIAPASPPAEPAPAAEAGPADPAPAEPVTTPPAG